MNHKCGHQHDAYKAVIKQKKADHARCDKYLTLQALIATHEQMGSDPVYIRELERKRDNLKNQLRYSGII